MEPNKVTDSYRVQYITTAVATLIIISDGMHFCWPSPSLPQLTYHDSDIKITSDEGSWLATMPLIGSMPGAFIASCIVNYMGRKTMMIAITIPLFASWIMIAFATSALELFLARFLAGFMSGFIFNVVPIYISEISHPKIRGFLSASCSYSWILGYLLINIVGSLANIRITAIIASVLPILAFVLIFRLPESSYYYLIKGEQEKAKESMRKLRRKLDVDSEINMIQSQLLVEMKTRAKLWDIFTVKSHRRAIYILAGLRFVQQFSGIMAIVFYTQEIFLQVDTLISAELGSIIFFLVQLITTVISSGIVDKAGRKPLMIISLAGSGVALLLEAAFFYVKFETNTDISSYGILSVVFLIAFVVMFSLGMQSIPMVMQSEIFATSVKGYAMFLGDVYYSVVAVICSKFLQLMKDNVGIYAGFLGFSLACFLGLFFLIYCVPETKGRTLEEIQEYFSSENKNLKINKSFKINENT